MQINFLVTLKPLSPHFGNYVCHKIKSSFKRDTYSSFAVKVIFSFGTYLLYKTCYTTVSASWKYFHRNSEKLSFLEKKAYRLSNDIILNNELGLYRLHNTEDGIEFHKLDDSAENLKPLSAKSFATYDCSSLDGYIMYAPKGMGSEKMIDKLCLASTNSLVEQAETLSSMKSSARSKIEGVLYVESDRSGCINLDNTFKFSERIKTVDGRPLKVAPSDVYIPCQGYFKQTPHFPLNKDADGHSYTFIYLPSSLFENVKEGEFLKFYYDDMLVEIKCQQHCHPMSKARQVNFEEAVQDVKNCVKREGKDILFTEDLYKNVLPKNDDFAPSVKITDENRYDLFLELPPPKNKQESGIWFKGKFLGEKINQIDLSGEVIDTISSMKFYKRDETKNGPAYETFDVQYVPADPEEEEEYGVFDRYFFNRVFKTKINLEDLHLFESIGVSGQYRLLIILPHKPDENDPNKFIKNLYKDISDDEKSLSDSSEWEISQGEGKREKEYSSHEPQQFRLAGYHHGKYTILTSPTPPASKKIFFNDDGVLQVDFELSSAELKEFDDL